METDTVLHQKLREWALNTQRETALREKIKSCEAALEKLRGEAEELQLSIGSHFDKAVVEELLLLDGQLFRISTYSRTNGIGHYATISLLPFVWAEEEGEFLK